MNNIEDIEKKKKIKYNADIEFIVKSILENIAEVQAIILCGGFGRDEGTWIIKDGDIMPYNDYDIAIITDTTVDVAFTEELRKNLAAEIGIHWVDIDYYPIKKLINLKASIKNFDLIYGSKIIYGNKNIFNDCSINAKEIGTDDIETLYFTRLWTFFGIIDGEFKNLDLDEAVFFRNQMAKAVLAIVDTLLIQKKNYHSSYCERIRRLENLCSEKTALVKMAKWALNEKLSPTMKPMSREDCIEIYNSVYWLYREEMLAALSDKYFFKLDKPNRYAWNFNMPIEIARKIYITNIRGVRGYKKACMSRVLQNAMFLAYNGGDIDEHYMKDVSNALKKLGCEYAMGWQWNKLCPLVAYIRNQK